MVNKREKLKGGNWSPTFVTNWAMPADRGLVQVSRDRTLKSADDKVQGVAGEGFRGHVVENFAPGKEQNSAEFLGFGEKKLRWPEDSRWEC